MDLAQFASARLPQRVTRQLEPDSGCTTLCLMKSGIVKPALLTIFLCLSMVAFAQVDNGSELRNSGTDYLRICSATPENQAKNYLAACNIWLTGVVDGLQAYNSNAKSLPLFDAPKITVGEASKLVAKFVANHPEKAQLPTAALVLGALAEKYPRKEASASKK